MDRFPQTQSIGVLQPLFTVSDVYLNLFRGIVPPIGGIDIRCVSPADSHGRPTRCGCLFQVSDGPILLRSPIGAFFVLNLLTNSVASLGATGPLPDRIPFGQAWSRKVQALQGHVDKVRTRLQIC